MNPKQQRHMEKLFESRVNRHGRDQEQSLFELVSNQVNPKDIKMLNDDFDEFYGQQLHVNGVYTFNNKEEAVLFFKQQATLQRSYLVKESGADNFLYSDDQGSFFNGSQNEFQDFLKSQLAETANVSTFIPRSEQTISNAERDLGEDDSSMAYGV